MIIYFFLLYSTLSVLSYDQTKPIQQLDIDLDYETNDSLLLIYNLTTNYSYFITFRSFGNEQLKFGLFTSNNETQKNIIEIKQEIHSLKLYIICFHFIRRLYDIDIRCKDVNLSKEHDFNRDLSQDFLPSYNPLFVPLMYALSILMLLPVIVQHHRNKKAQKIERHKHLKRLSMSIAQDPQNPKQNLGKKMLSILNENRNIDVEQIPMDIELISVPSTRTILDEIDDGSHVTFTLNNPQLMISDSDVNNTGQQSEINADDCIAHLLNNTPWNTNNIEQPLLTSLSIQRVVRDCPTGIKEQQIPVIISIPHDDFINDDRQPILKTNKHSNINRTFIESDV